MSISTRAALPYCLFLLGFTPPLSAQDAPAKTGVLSLPAFVEQKIELNQPVTTPLRRESTLRDATRPAYVVTREELEAQGTLTVDEALKYLPGIRTEGTAGGQVGALSAQIARGGSSAQVLILLDGRPINDLGGFGGFDLSQFSTDALEQIEVVPSGASTLHGADAVGGVVNLITRKATTKDRLAASVGVGSFGLNSQALRFSGSRGPVSWSLGYQRLRADSSFAYTINTPTTFEGLDAGGNPQFGTTRQPVAGVRQNADVTENNLDGRIDWHIDSRNRLGVSVLWLDKNLGVPGGIPITTDSVGNPDFGSFGGFNGLTLQSRQFTGSIFTQLQWESDLGEGDDSRLTARIYGDLLNLRFVDRFNNGDFNNRSDTQSTSLGAQVQHTWQISPGQTLTYGLDYRTVSARSTSLSADGSNALNYDSSYSQGALFVQDELRLTPEWTTVLGVRQDLNTTGSQTNPSVGARWQVTPTTALRGNYARSFRAPVISSVAGFGVFQVGNPTVRPERADSYDIGIDQKIGNIGLLRFTYYTNTIADLNQFTFDPNTFLGRVENLGLTRAQGIETSLDFQVVENVYLGANYTTVDARILDDPDPTLVGKNLFFRPNVFNVNLTYQNRYGWYAGVFVRTVGSFFTTSDNLESLPGYTTVDLKFQWPLAPSLALNLGVNNLLDQRFEESPGFPGLGLDVRAALKWSFTP
ncbi:TonB-dependent receptor plug domain-containing protein [Anthocerotibacter panamensis]|uniref:TonB-dependent receptor plug domain-containing protein n=1 Tax=Anthocerotibacter panamensis TaxID=2857077 RepID=UPI001C40642A|nr:TonB-dependent receptor [Anthocerotibacter panamensis]